MLTGYWPPTNEMLRQFSTDPVQNPGGWQGQNWEGRGYDIYAFFPEFPGGTGSNPKGDGDFEVDYQDVSNDFWLITEQIHPVAIMSYGAGAGPWEIEYNARNLSSWSNDYLTPKQPTPSPPDSSQSTGYVRNSTLPVQDIADAINASGLGISAWVDWSGNPGAFLCEYMAYHDGWYQDIHSNPNDAYYCAAAGFTHLSNSISVSNATEGVEVALRATIAYLDSILIEDNNAPVPDPLVWASVPTATGSGTITMTATTATDDTSSVEYYFECTTDANADSGWQADTTYVASGLNPSTSYTFRVKARDLSSNHNETGWSTAESATTTSGPIESQDFEAGLGNWSNVTGDDYDWTRDSGGTPSSNTGPSSGANSSTWYMYLETSDGSGAYDAGDTAFLEGPDLDADAYDMNLSFYYHMYGADMGTLYVDVYNGSSWDSSVWSISGQQHSSSSEAYTQANVDLSSYSGNIKLRFRAVAAGGYMGDMAIDNIEITGSPISSVTVPDITGMSQADANTAIEAVGLTVGIIITQCSDTVPAGDVISQDPNAGTSAPIGSAVDLLVSSGQPSVPDVTGMIESAAIAAISAVADISYGSSSTTCSDTAGPGEVISQSETGTVACGTVVDLVVSSGQPSVPDVTGMDEAGAIALINSVSYISYGSSSTQCSDTVPAGNVISYSPTGTVPCGTVVDFVISRGQPVVPNVAGYMTPEEACDTLDAIPDISCGTITYQCSDIITAGYVISQSVTGTVPCGTAVDLVVSSGQPSVPDVTGMDEAAAIAAINAIADISYGSSSTTCSDTVGEGDVISQSITGTVPCGTVIDLVVSSGQPSVPDVTGMDEAAAIAEINAVADISYGSSYYECSNTFGAGVVISQTLTGTVACGAVINLAVSSGQPSVPDVTGMDEAAAIAAINAEPDISYGISTTEYSDTVSEGDVISQSAAGTAACGTVVDLVVSLGPCTADVPDVTGMSEPAAISAINAVAYISYGTSSTVCSDTVGAGNVISQSVTGTVDCGTIVDLVISSGQPEVPDVITLSEASAIYLINQVDGISYGSSSTVCSDGIPAGDVVNQSATGTVACGTIVNLVISSGQPLVPDVTGMDEAIAIAAINAVADISYGSTTTEYSDTVGAGDVISQSATGTVACGTVVDLVVSLGSCTADVPDVTGMSEAAAIAAIDAVADISYGSSSTEHSSTVPAGDCISQSATGAVPCGTVVDLVISLGPNLRTISGYIIEVDANMPFEDVSVIASNGGGSDITDVNGYYEITVDYGWSGTVTPTKISYMFTPADRTYTNVTSDQTEQNYTAVYTITVILESEDFESGFGNWSNVSGDDADWTRYQGSTPSNGTGPDHDNTIGDETGWYLYMESSNPVANGDEAYLESPEFDADTYSIELKFYYHMYGSAMGSLNVDIFDGVWNNSVWSVSGQQHTSSSDNYALATVDLSAYTGMIKIRFRGIDSTSYTSDMAIDDITVAGTLDDTQMTISGYVTEPNANPIEGVSIDASNGGSSGMTDANGYYEVLVDYNWSGTITPSKYAYGFEPNSITYTDVTENTFETQDYIGTLLTYKITGYIKNECAVPIADVAVDANNGGSWDTTDANGFYEVWVDYDWSGTITPSDSLYVFEPNSTAYINILADVTNQDYTANNIYDLDCDGFIGFGDVAVMGDNWLLTGPNIPGDFYDDDILNYLDFSDFAEVW
ncbi:MAG: PASTA domain-containing protein [Sedimentisphaerales bacterium]|nr:PASTA domain-containing protein [Sedimentisphaerales bacterium]